MHHYHAPMPNWSPWWLVGTWAAIVLMLAAVICEGPAHHEVGVRHTLPDPYVPGCYAVEWRSGQYCEFRPVKRIGNN